MLTSGFLAEFDTKSDDGVIGKFSGVASTDDPDRTGDIVEAGAFGTINAAEVAMFWAHDPKSVIGGWKSFEQKGHRLVAEGELNLKTRLGAETYELMKAGHVTGLSVGFFIKPGGASWDDKTGMRRIKSASLIEVSIVAVPAQNKARVKRVKSAFGDECRKEFSETLKNEYGFTPEEIDVILTKGYDALLAERSRKSNVSAIVPEIAKQLADINALFNKRA